MAKNNIPFVDKEFQEISEEVFVYDGRKTFKGQTWVKNVTFLIGTKSIKENAFEGCTGIESIVIPEGVTTIDSNAFFGCTNLKEVSLPESLTEIGVGAFSKCSSLVHFYIPKKLSALGYYSSDIVRMFEGCCNLTSFEVHPENEKFSSYNGLLIVRDTLLICPQNSKETIIDALPEKVSSIDKKAFQNCKTLEVINIPENIKAGRGELSFAGCCNLKELIIPQTADCTDLILKNCSNLKKIAVPASVEKINITGCSLLTDVEVDSSNNHLKVIDGCIISDDKLIDALMNITDVVIPEGVVGISRGSLVERPNLTSITIPASVKNIDYEVFFRSDNLKEIRVSADNEYFVVKDGMLMSKDETELYFCPSKEGEIVIPTTVQKVQNGTFTTCKSENTRIVMPPKFDNYNNAIFEGAENCTVCIADTPKEISNDIYSFTKNLKVEFYCASKTKSIKRDYRFYNVKSVKFNVPIINICYEGFFNCNKMTDLVLPDTLKEIGKLAFQNCSSLEALVLPDSVATIGEKAFVGVKQVEMSNVCVAEKTFFDLDAPICFEGTAGRLFYPESTGAINVHGIDTDESRQRFELHKHWFGDVKPALQKAGCSFFYWDMTENTFAARLGDCDFVFNGLEIIPTEKVVGLVSTLNNALHSSSLKMKLTASLGKAKEKAKAKAAPKKSLFVKAEDTAAQETAAAKKEKLEFMIEQVFLAQVNEYQSQNENVLFQVCSSNKNNVELGVNYKDRFCFTTSIAASVVEDGTAADAITNMLKKLDEDDIEFKVV